MAKPSLFKREKATPPSAEQITNQENGSVVNQEPTAKQTVKSPSGRVMRGFRILDKVTDKFILVLLTIAIIIGAAWLLDTQRIMHEADSSNWTIYKPAVDNSESFDQLHAINPDILSWVRLNETGLDYPVAWSENSNREYLSKDPKGRFSLSGTPFWDYRSNPHCPDNQFSAVIYGHHMSAGSQSGSMFSPLFDYADKEFFDSHKYGSLFYNGEDHGLVVFGYAHINASDKLYDMPINRDRAEWYLNRVKDLCSIYDESVPIDITKDQIVMLSTCSATETLGRDVVFAKIVPELYPEAEKEPEPPNIIDGVDAFKGFLEKIPLWIPFILLMMLVVNYVLLLYGNWKHRKREIARGKMLLEEARNSVYSSTVLPKGAVPLPEEKDLVSPKSKRKGMGKGKGRKTTKRGRKGTPRKDDVKAETEDTTADIPDE